VKLCESCHDGKKATREKHPVNVEQVVKTDLPLKDNKVTCISCHDIKNIRSLIYRKPILISFTRMIQNR
jgi:hypothetical protein